MPGIERAGAIGAILLTGSSYAKSFAQQIEKESSITSPGMNRCALFISLGTRTEHLQTSKNTHFRTLRSTHAPTHAEHPASCTYIWNWRAVSLGCVADSVEEGKPVEVSNAPHLLPPLTLKELPDGPGETAGPGEPGWGPTCAALICKMSEASQRAPGCTFCGKHPSSPSS